MPDQHPSAATADLRVPARLRESTHDSLAAPPVTFGAANGRPSCIRRFPLRNKHLSVLVILARGAAP